jgi:hypothetical protein
VERYAEDERGYGSEPGWHNGCRWQNLWRCASKQARWVVPHCVSAPTQRHTRPHPSTAQAAEYAHAQEYPYCMPDGLSGTAVCYSYAEFLALQQRTCAGRRDFAVAIIIWALAVELP